MHTLAIKKETNTGGRNTIDALGPARGEGCLTLVYAAAPRITCLGRHIALTKSSPVPVATEALSNYETDPLKLA
ncbi:unnamed protein product, partial [Iphiclides podalirius]